MTVDSEGRFRRAQLRNRSDRRACGKSQPAAGRATGRACGDRDERPKERRTTLAADWDSHAPESRRKLPRLSSRRPTQGARQGHGWDHPEDLPASDGPSVIFPALHVTSKCVSRDEGGFAAARVPLAISSAGASVSVAGMTGQPLLGFAVPSAMARCAGDSPDQPRTLRLGRSRRSHLPLCRIESRSTTLATRARGSGTAAAGPVEASRTAPPRRELASPAWKSACERPAFALDMTVLERGQRPEFTSTPIDSPQGEGFPPSLNPNACGPAAVQSRASTLPVECSLQERGEQS